MKKIAVCYKWVLSGEDIRIEEKSRSLNFEKCKGQISEYDRVALEAGVHLKTASGAELVGLTCGVSGEASSKEALSRGPDAVYYLDSAALSEADSTVTARVLAAMLKHLNVDIVICAEGSSDDYAQQTGPRIAALLGYPSISYVSKIDVMGETLKLERKLDEGTETVEMSGPLVISVVPDIGEAPIPSVKQILGAKKKPSHALTPEGIGLTMQALTPFLKVVSVKAPITSRKAVRMNPEGVGIEEAVAKLAKQLTADGAL